MSSCNGKTITPRDIARTTGEIKSIFLQAKADHWLPPNAKLKIQDNYYGVAAAGLTNSVTADPIFLSCFNKTEIKAIIGHEMGHRHDLLLYGLVPALIPQSVFIWVMVLYTIQSLSSLLFGSNVLVPSKKRTEKLNIFKRAGNAILKWRPTKKHFFAALCAHTLYGAALLESFRSLETRADLYSAHLMGSGKPLISFFQKINTVSMDAAVNDSGQDLFSPIGMIDEIYVNKKRFGILAQPFGVLPQDHPSDEERINVLRNYRPGQPLPIGMLDVK